MPLETGTKVPDLNNAWPLGSDPKNQGDDHLRLIKTCLQGSFPSLGSGQYTGTAAELDQVNTNLSAFNGRTVRDVVPTEGDYSLDLLGDVSINSPSQNDMLIYDGGEWKNSGSGVAAYNFVYTGFAGWSVSNGNRWYMDTESNDAPTSLVTIDNSSGTGWLLTAVRPCKVDLSIFTYITATTQSKRAIAAVNNNNNLAGSDIPTASRLHQHTSFRTNSAFVTNAGASVVLQVNETISLHGENGINTFEDSEWFVRGVVSGAI